MKPCFTRQLRMGLSIRLVAEHGADIKRRTVLETQHYAEGEGGSVEVAAGAWCRYRSGS